MMRLRDLLRSMGAAFEHRLRAALTVLGVGIGAGSIVLLASLLHGGERALVMADQEAAGDDVVEVHREDPAPRLRHRTARPLSRDDAAALASAETLKRGLVAAESSFDVWARLEGRRKRVAIVSESASTFALYRLSVARGRRLDEDDRRGGRRVCVVGDEVYSELARSAPLGGLRLEVEGELFAVVGVLAPKTSLDSTDGTSLWSRKVLIPSTTYDALYAPSHAVDRIYVRDPGLTTTARATLRAFVRALFLRRHHGLENFELAKDQSGGKEKLVLGSIQVLLLGTGFLALLAAGINIMNVMLVTVRERAREIGLRRALGATRACVLQQFLFEAAALSVVGGAAGLAGGATLALLLAALFRASLGHWDFVIPPWSLAIGLSLALLTGLVFGALPAWRAARLAPIDALRAH